MNKTHLILTRDLRKLIKKLKKQKTKKQKKTKTKTNKKKQSFCFIVNKSNQNFILTIHWHISDILRTGYTKMCYDQLWHSLSHYESLWATMFHYYQLWAITMSKYDSLGVTMRHYNVSIYSEPLWANMSHSKLLDDDVSPCNNSSDCFRSKKNVNLIYSMLEKKLIQRKKYSVL